MKEDTSLYIYVQSAARGRSIKKNQKFREFSDEQKKRVKNLIWQILKHQQQNFQHVYSQPRHKWRWSKHLDGKRVGNYLIGYNFGHNIQEGRDPGGIDGTDVNAFWMYIIHNIYLFINNYCLNRKVNLSCKIDFIIFN